MDYVLYRLFFALFFLVFLSSPVLYLRAALSETLQVNVEFLHQDFWWKQKNKHLYKQNLICIQSAYFKKYQMEIE